MLYSLSDLRDSSGVRFYLGDGLRQHDLGYLVFGTLSKAAALAIPPKTKQFIVDSYCPPEATRVCLLFYSHKTSDYSHVLLCQIEFSEFWYQCSVRFATYSLARYMTYVTMIILKSIYFCIGVSVWTKLIRNNTAVQYLFNAEAYDFNYQFENRLPKPIKIYPVRK